VRDDRVTPNFSEMYTVEAIRAAFAATGVSTAKLDEIAEAQEFAARLIGGKVASSATLTRVQTRTGICVFVYREGGVMTAMVAYVLFSERGLRALFADRFNAYEPASSHLTRQGEEPAGVYGWGVAATNHPAARQVVAGYELMRQKAAPHLPFFGRPVTEAGRRLMFERLHYKPVPGSTTGVVWLEPFAGSRAAAA
jgi:hypothetical protein